MTEEVAVKQENHLVTECWNLVVQHSNRILHHAGLHGLSLMEMSNPNIRELLQLLKVGIMPVLRELEEVGTLNPMNGVRIATMKQTIRCIYDITVALDSGNQVDFATAVRALRSQPLIH